MFVTRGNAYDDFLIMRNFSGSPTEKFLWQLSLFFYNPRMPFLVDSLHMKHLIILRPEVS